MAATDSQRSFFKLIFKKPRALILHFVLLILIHKSVLARNLDLTLVNNFMLQDGKGGKQVADGTGDQHLMIFEPILFLDAKVGHDTTIFGSALIDLWTSASESIFDSTTGASGAAVSAASSAVSGNNNDDDEDEDEDDDDSATGSSGGESVKLQKRMSFSLGVSQKLKTWTVTPSFGYSTEYDYTSLNGGINVAKSFADENFTVSVGYHLFLDKTWPFDVVTAAFSDWKNKTTHSFDASVSQILSPSDLVLLSYNFTKQDGFLRGSQNSIDLNGTRISEVLPDSRLRNALAARYIHGFSDNISTHLDYRFYFDDWGIMAHTIEPSLYFGFAEDTALLKLYYRFHMQDGADYYADSFNQRFEYMTSDSDLAKFQAHEGGVVLSKTFETNWGGDGIELSSINLNLTGLYYWRSNDLHAQIYQFGIGGSFK